MPLVRRKLTEELEHLYSKHTTVHTMYVAPSKKLPGDEVVPIAEIPDEMLIDLAITYPREYGKAAAAKALDLTQKTDGQDDDEYEPEVEFTEDQEAFLALGDDEALEVVAATNNPDELASYIEAEQKSAAPRRAVLEAIGKKG